MDPRGRRAWVRLLRVDRCSKEPEAMKPSARVLRSLPALISLGLIPSGCLEGIPLDPCQTGDCGLGDARAMPDVTPERETPKADAALPHEPPSVPVGMTDDEVPAPNSPPPPLVDAGPPAAPQEVSDVKVDLLIMVDNSISMSDKQALLRRTAPDLLAGLVNPPCIDAAGNRAPAPGPDLACPPGLRREFLPVRDINIGVISSSLGDVGANVACRAGERDDRAHLMGSLPRGEGHGTSALGVLELRPGGDVAAFGAGLQGLLDSVGQGGCGWEMSLESWYRFLVDPAPYERLERVQCPGSASAAANCVQPAVDEQSRVLADTALLEQRTAFLRPDSLLSIVMLSDENDCSLQLAPQSWVVAAIDDSRPMFRGSSICATNPNDACCYSCPLGPPSGCTEDPVCDADEATGSLQNRLPSNEDGTNLRCFEQKRRFGIDFLYPTARYVNALSERELCLEAPDLSADNCPGIPVQNPLFAGGRAPSSVYLGGIVGVPWQEIVSDRAADGQPLAAGELRFKSPGELDNEDWTALVGNAAASPPVLPTSPFMIESPRARAGITAGNPINGREYDTTSAFTLGAPDDLEYACIFPLPAPRDCAALDSAVDACDCYAGDNDRPLCEAMPGQSAATTTQLFAKAYPGSRQLEVLRGHGANASVASICARNVTDPSRSDFGYRPAMSGVLERMSSALTHPEP